MTKDKVAQLKTAFNNFLATANHTSLYLKIEFHHPENQQPEEENNNETNVITAFYDIPKFLMEKKEDFMNSEKFVIELRILFGNLFDFIRIRRQCHRLSMSFYVSR